MALLGHVTPEMTLRYARLASPTVRTAYEAAMGKVWARSALVIPAGSTTAVPARVDWLAAEMLKTRLAFGGRVGGVVGILRHPRWSRSRRRKNYRHTAEPTTRLQPRLALNRVRLS